MRINLLVWKTVELWMMFNIQIFVTEEFEVPYKYDSFYLDRHK